MGWMSDAFGFGFGAGVGYSATNGMINAVESGYRAQYFDPAVRQDFRDIITGGMLQNINYPFPQKGQKPAWRPFVIRHKVFSVSVLAYFVLFSFLSRMDNLYAMEVSMRYFTIFWFICIIVMLVKKIQRGGKKIAEISYQSTYIKYGQQYWRIREYVRQALQTGELDAQGAIARLKSTELGQQLPDTLTEIEANAFYARQR